MAFDREEVSELLARCHRRCCICHRFCGTKIETDHIEPRAESHNDDIENAIPVCFECHAEVHSYNDKHPRGRKFTAEELRRHRDQWIAICERSPAVLVGAIRDRDVGPLQALYDELEFNRAVGVRSTKKGRGAQFLNTQFLRAVQEGAVSILEETLKQSIHDAYAAMSHANQHIFAEANENARSTGEGKNAMNASKGIDDSVPLIESALAELRKFLAGNAGQ